MNSLAVDNQRRSSGVVLLALWAAAVVGVSCASEPPRDVMTQFVVTDSSIQEAEQAGAATSALPELQMAKDKRNSAQRAFDDKEYDSAMRLAQQAQMDAVYASRKSQAAESRRSAAEVDRAHETLRREAERPQTDSERSDTQLR